MEDVGEGGRDGGRDSRDVSVGDVVIAAIGGIQQVARNAPAFVEDRDSFYRMDSVPEATPATSRAARE
jgi:hypothetical protein